MNGATGGGGLWVRARARAKDWQLEGGRRAVGKQEGGRARRQGAELGGYGDS